MTPHFSNSELLKLYALYSSVGLYLLWIFYLAGMNLSRAKKAGTLNKTSLVLGTPVLIIGYLLDFLVNVLVMTVILAELPRETTVTARLKRHNNPEAGWRYTIARWFEQILDPYDPDGDHI